MSYYYLIISGGEAEARHAARGYGVRIYDIDTEYAPLVTYAQAPLCAEHRLDRWYRESGEVFRQIDAATPPKIRAYHDSLPEKEKLEFELELVTSGKSPYPKGLLQCYQPVAERPWDAVGWILVRWFLSVFLPKHSASPLTSGASAPPRSFLLSALLLLLTRWTRPSRRTEPGSPGLLRPVNPSRAASPRCRPRSRGLPACSSGPP